MGYVYNDMERLRFWCQKVLPTVYDDSLSYYELLCKVVQYLNDTVENVNTLIQQVADIDADLSNVAIIQDSGMSTEYVWSSSYTNTKMNDKIHNSIINMRSAGSTGATYSCQYLTNNFAELENGKIKSSELPSDIVNTIEGIKVNGSTVNPDANKIVNLVVMTNAVDNLINYYTKTQTYSKSEVDTIASNIRNSRFEVVQSLPTTGIQTNVIYLVPKTIAGTQDGYNEYINLDGTTSGWELIGSTDIDLSGYVTTTDLNNALANYVTTLTLTGILNNYITVGELATELASYATVSAMNTALAGKQNTLTFDNFPTAGSTNPVTSGGVKSATTEIWGVIGTIEAGLTSTHAYEVGDHIICWIGFAEVIAPIAVGDSLERNVNVVEGTIAEAVSGNLRGINTNTELIKDTVGWVNTNLNGTKYESRTASDVVFTVQANGGVAIGASTAGSSNAQTPNDSNLASASFEAKYTGQVTLIGGYNENIHIVPYDYTDSARPYKDSTMSTRLGGSDNAYPNHDVSFYMIAGHRYSMNIRVVHDTVIPSGVVVYAMLCKQGLIDKSYEPYRNTTAFPRDEQAILGARNRLPAKYKDGTGKVDGELTWTVDSDGVVDADGSTGNTQSVFWLTDNVTFEEAMRLVGCPSGASSSTYCFGGTYVGAEVTKDIPANTQFSVACVVKPNQTVSHIKFEPLLKLATDPSDNFSPPTMTNRELTEKLTPNDITVTPATGITFNTTNTRCIKEGDKCLFNVDTQSISLTADTTLEIGSIPSADAPKQPVFGFAYSYNTGSAVRLTINANGKITLLSKTALTNDYIQGSVSWFVNR